MQTLENLFQEFIKENFTIPIGTKFIYEGKLCTVVGAILHLPSYFDFFQELNANKDIWLLLDIPTWNIEGEPDSKVTWSLGRFDKAVETGAINIVA